MDQGCCVRAEALPLLIGQVNPVTQQAARPGKTITVINRKIAIMIGKKRLDPGDFLVIFRQMALDINVWKFLAQGLNHGQLFR